MLGRGALLLSPIPQQGIIMIIEVNYDGEVYHYSAAEDVIPDDNGYLKIVLSGGNYVRFPLRYVVYYSVDGIRKDL